MTKGAYKSWLALEHRSIAWELADHPRMVDWFGGGLKTDRYDVLQGIISLENRGVSRFHQYDGAAAASDRAALVLSTVGCDWRKG